ncbi:tRNA lysidine(34) synthetase TilS [Sulfurimonas sp.]|nr:tRNA lysidine(34) synthetase TilS [Sulfurimonas sp.]
MLEEKTLLELRGKKNLLAFSAGGDSTALFFLLLKNKITFDIAIVDYGVRAQSEDEVLYAQELANKYNLTCKLLKAPKIDSNFESKAREIRYSFFEELISTCRYDNLLTAHHLGDRLEWMLMQFCKGAGVIELAGMKSIEKRDSYKLLRPLLQVGKSELLKFLHVENIKYFEDETNQDESIRRNSFRHKYSQPLLEENLSGIKKSFEYLDEDRDSLVKELHVENLGEFAYFKNSHNQRSNILAIDKYLKSNIYMLSASERHQLKSEITVTVGRKFVINQSEDYVFITPLTKQENMEKEFKEKMRLLHVEPKLRPYFYQNHKALVKLEELLSCI